MSSSRSLSLFSIAAVLILLGLVAVVATSVIDEPSTAEPPKKEGAVDSTTEVVTPVDAPTPKALSWEAFKQIALTHNSFKDADEELLRRRYLHWEVDGQKYRSFPLDAHLDNGTLKALDRQDLYALIDQHNHGIEGLLAMANHRLKEAFEDYYGEARFDRFPAGEEVPERTREGSSFWRDGGVTEVSGEQVRVAFRSSEYPALEETLQELARLRDARNEAVMAMIERIR